jgi:hypothetical protein
MVQDGLKKQFWITWGAILLLIALALAITLPGLMPGYRPSNERKPETSLKTIVSAQIEFRTKDPGKTGVRQFWRKDIAGLYTLRPRNDPAEPAIKLIELAVACADDRAGKDLDDYAVKAPKAGYWFRAIRHADETSLSPERFAAVAFPASYPTSGKDTFIVDERNFIYRANLGHGRGIDVFPTDKELQKRWAKLD